MEWKNYAALISMEEELDRHVIMCKYIDTSQTPPILSIVLIFSYLSQYPLL